MEMLLFLIFAKIQKSFEVQKNILYKKWVIVSNVRPKSSHPGYVLANVAKDMGKTFYVTIREARYAGNMNYLYVSISTIISILYYRLNLMEF